MTESMVERMHKVAGLRLVYSSLELLLDSRELLDVWLDSYLEGRPRQDPRIELCGGIVFLEEVPLSVEFKLQRVLKGGSLEQPLLRRFIADCVDHVLPIWTSAFPAANPWPQEATHAARCLEPSDPGLYKTAIAAIHGALWAAQNQPKGASASHVSRAAGNAALLVYYLGNAVSPHMRFQTAWTTLAATAKARREAGEGIGEFQWQLQHLAKLSDPRGATP